MALEVKEHGWRGPLGEGPLVGWVGDDFTGAAATMEVLTFAGLPSILFLVEPTEAQRARFAGAFGLGIATMARTQPPEWMDVHLPRLFRAVRESGAAIVHYKVCSTLDSAPGIGSIGRAMEIGLEVVGGRAVPIVVAAPPMRRYQAFGHLFAAAPDGVHRLDRHPVMARHPVTPMTESDVARHLSDQTRLPLACLDLEALADREAARRRMSSAPPGGWTIDQMGPAEEAAAGALIWEGRRDDPFVIGSQGVEYALVRYWREAGLLAPAPPAPRLEPTDRLAAVSGSVSPTTAAQIDAAEQAGFAPIALDAAALLGSEADAAETRAADAALKALARGAPPLVHSARGPEDPAVARLRAAAEGRELAQVNRRIGRALGRVLARLIETGGLRRAVVSGGDTSGDVCAELGIYALSALAPTIPGAAICRAHADGPMDGLEIALKGGQMGSPDYFDWIRRGGGEAA